MRLLALAGAFGLALVATGPLATQADAVPVRHALLRPIQGRRGELRLLYVQPVPRVARRQRRHLHDGTYQGDVIRVHTPYGPYRIRN